MQEIFLTDLMAAKMRFAIGQKEIYRHSVYSFRDCAISTPDGVVKCHVDLYVGDGEQTAPVGRVILTDKGDYDAVIACVEQVADSLPRSQREKLDWLSMVLVVLQLVVALYCVYGFGRLFTTKVSMYELGCMLLGIAVLMIAEAAKRKLRICKFFLGTEEVGKEDGVDED